jgi:hypothetical protein
VRWAGIDEAGYGPNLGPMVMTAIVAEAPEDGGQAEREPPLRTLNFWADLKATVDRAGGDRDRLWVDDSKTILRGGKGRDRLESACWALIHAIRHKLPCSFGELLAGIGAGTPEDTELSLWSTEPGGACCSLALTPPPGLSEMLAERPLEPRQARWRLTEVRSVVVAPAQFNARLKQSKSKSEVHFAAFAPLVRMIWERAAVGDATFLSCDKHGGKHYYLPALYDAFPEAWIERGPEGAELSRYVIRAPGRMVELSLLPRADRSDGLVALASIVSKTVRELWMDVFNGYWCARVPGLCPTAGYPVDALRFRRAIEAAARAVGRDPSFWWRDK